MSKADGRGRHRADGHQGALGRGGAEPDHRGQGPLRHPARRRPAAPRAKNTNAPFRGLGTSKDASRGTGGKSRKADEARKLAEARKAARVRRGN